MTTSAGDVDQELEHAGLSELDKRILEFGRARWNYDGRRDQAIRALFGISPTRYYQRLNQLLDSPEALAFDPVNVNRLRRVRDQRREARSVRSLTG